MFFNKSNKLYPCTKQAVTAIIPITAHRISTMISIAVITFAVYLRAIIKSRQ